MEKFIDALLYDDPTSAKIEEFFEFIKDHEPDEAE